MAKSSGKKIRNEVQDIGRSSAKKYFRKLKKNKSMDAVYSVENRALTPVVDAQKMEEFSGFIFMCNGKTKPECYVNRVFGLPSGKREVVEKIKPGMKLFLFDFDVKLLYGVYEASSNGAMNLEPAAFGERFPAQVRFRIYKDCLPLHLNSFRTAIKDNYHGSKFAPELNGQQVRDLLSLFRPIVAPSPASVLPYGALQLQMPPTAINVQLNSSLTPHLQNSYRPHLAGLMHSLPAQQVIGSQPVPQNMLNPHLHHLHPAPGNPYQCPETRQAYFLNDLPQTMQEPYPRYTTTPRVYPHGEPVGLEVGYDGSAVRTQREPLPNHVGYHNFQSMLTAAHDHSHVNAPPCYSVPDSSHVHTPPCYSGPTYRPPQPPPSGGPQMVEGSTSFSSYYSRLLHPSNVDGSQKIDEFRTY
ncbi:uncharacterized protein LOC112511407 [Cynara cardunculus var. scolymus]|uniref:Development/cell death domain-containing protein n=1 Tax=Cynara cardunculus var. scolymus TaxID=59895 RepID=A0A103XWC6_CYNCS|nr:uncharacterized protein LOC112511407 [Cynara cardunculus var. scolymus]XP_024972777.1 uncharacterized protein LOC112511407 [Cynara cardunculus var. scolymus]XP_024972778.1 uncharacterized protein LOC112511407 [Cynara cardunculus var. scolymus]KVH98105.1 Development/cell death domain-containing protein [Cynara cardunculus var. scolymus]